MAGCSDVPHRIVHVSDCYAPRIGGIELQVNGLVEAQNAAGREAVVVTTTPGRAEPDVHRLVSSFSIRAFSYDVPVDPAVVAQMSELFARIRPDVVHVHLGALAPLAWAAARCAVASRIPLVASVHSTWGAPARVLYGGLSRSVRWTEWPMVLTAVSRVVADRVLAVTGGRVRQEVVPNGLDVGLWRRAHRAPDGPRAGTCLSLVTVGRLAPRKRILSLLRILRMAARRLAPARRLRMTIVGDGPFEPALRAYLEHYGMTDQVRLVGRLDRARVPDVLVGADAFVAPASRESFGLAALEARAAGLPVIAHHDGGVADYVTHRLDGLLCCDDREFADAIVQLARDDDLRGALTEASALRPPLASDWPQVTARFDDCYATAAALVGGPDPVRTEHEGRR